MKTLTHPALVVALLLVSAGCSSTIQQPRTPSPVPSTPGAETPGAETPGAETPVPSATPSAVPSAITSEAPTEAREIELELNAELQIVLDGEQVEDITVTPGETILFRVTNTAGYTHNFMIGPKDALMASRNAELTGIPDFIAGTEEFEWTVPDDITGLGYGSTVPGQYLAGMHGTFSTVSTPGAETPGAETPVPSAAS